MVRERNSNSLRIGDGLVLVAHRGDRGRDELEAHAASSSNKEEDNEEEEGNQDRHRHRHYEGESAHGILITSASDVIADSNPCLDIECRGIGSRCFQTVRQIVLVNPR